MDLPEGFLGEEEAACLAELAAGKTVLEIGSWYGRSTTAMARTALQVVAVDHFRGGVDQPGGGTLWTFPGFWKGLEDRGLTDKVLPIVGRFGRVAPILRAYSFGLAFVDADHTYEATIGIGRLAAALVGPGGRVVFHDYAPGWPEVMRAVNELCGDFGGPEPLVGTLVALPQIKAGLRAVASGHAGPA